MLRGSHLEVKQTPCFARTRKSLTSPELPSGRRAASRGELSARLVFVYTHLLRTRSKNPWIAPGRGSLKSNAIGSFSKWERKHSHLVRQTCCARVPPQKTTTKDTHMKVRHTNWTRLFLAMVGRHRRHALSGITKHHQAPSGIHRHSGPPTSIHGPHHPPIAAL